MVEYAINLDSVFQALADPTRRDILQRLCGGPLSVSELAEKYTMSFAAVAKHLSVLEKARLAHKSRRGKQQIASVMPETIHIAEEHLRRYERIWQERFDTLEELLTKEEHHE